MELWSNYYVWFTRKVAWQIVATIVDLLNVAYNMFAALLYNQLVLYYEWAVGE